MKKLILILLLTIAVPTIVYSMSTPSVDNTESGAPISKDLVLKYCKWYISTLPSDNPDEMEARGAIAAFIVTYASETKDFSIKLGGAVAKMLELNGSGGNSDLLAVYLAGETIYCLEHDLKVSDATSFASAMNDVMNFYSRLPEHNVKILNKYLDMDESKRFKKFEKIYKEN